MKKTIKRKRRLNYGRLYDCVLFVAFPIISVFFLLTINKLTDKYALWGLLALSLIFILSILSVKLNKPIVCTIRRILLTLLSIALIWATMFAKENINSFLNIVDTKIKDEEVVFDLLVKKDQGIYVDEINNLNDLNERVIAYQQGGDAESNKKIEANLDQKLESYQRLYYEDYPTMFRDFYNGLTNAIVVNQSQRDILPAEYATLYEDCNVLESYTYKVKQDVQTNNIDITKEPFTVLISGTDDVGAPTSHSKSDMNMVVFVDPVARRITTISIPRDAYIPNPAYDNVSDKLTHTGDSGIENTVSAVEQALAIEIDFHVKISFTSLIEVVDILDGIDVDVAITFEEQDENRSFAEEDLIRLNAGNQTLNGKQTLAYARHRYGYVDQDLGRNQAQTAIIKGIIRKIASPSGVSKISEVLKVIPKYVLMNFSNTQLTDFTKNQVDDLSPWTTESVSMLGGVDDLDYTASGGYEPLSIRFLSRSDIIQVNAIYNLFKNHKPLSEVTFDLSNPYESFANYDEMTEIELVP